MLLDNFSLKTSKWSQLTICILTNLLTSISEKCCPNFEQINNPPRPVGNRGRFSNMSGLSSSTYLTCVKSNWPISNLRSESDSKYSNRTRTIAGKSVNNPYGEPVCRLAKIILFSLKLCLSFFKNYAL